MNLINEIKSKVTAAFAAAGHPNADTLVKVSDRPDMSDFQSNGVLPLAKASKQNPRAIAESIAENLRKDAFFKSVTVDGPGFINMSVADTVLGDMAGTVFTQPKLGYERADKPKTIVLDFGSPNLAKAMHVGHLRAHVIGESIKRILQFAGDKVIGDNHIGDWGKPMGLLIAWIQEKQPNLPYFDPNHKGAYPTESPFTATDLENMYPAAAGRAKTDEAFEAKAQEYTKMLQDGNPGYRALWQHFVDASIASMNEIYDELDIHFDLWRGESYVHDYLKGMVTRLTNEGFIVPDDGAQVIKLGKAKGGNDLPPLIMVKSNGAFMYGATDLATIETRINDFHPDEIVYVTDARQALHFEQVFKGADIVGLAKQVGLQHYGFGTVNGKDNKPYKTRDGGVMSLRALIDLAKAAALHKMESGEMGRDLTPAEKQKISAIVGVSALKFFDMTNDMGKNYIFDEEKLTSLEGKTGPYCLYALVRMKSVLERLNVDTTLLPGDHIVITHPAERQLLLKLYALPETVQTAYDNRAPHVITDYLFKVAQDFNLFYHDCPIKDATPDVQKSRITLVKCTLAVGTAMANLLGMQVPDKM